jgi:hypothetical protein
MRFIYFEMPGSDGRSAMACVGKVQSLVEPQHTCSQQSESGRDGRETGSLGLDGWMDGCLDRDKKVWVSLIICLGPGAQRLREGDG